MAEMYAVKKSDLTAIADAIRLKREIVSDIEVEDMATQIGLIDTGGGEELANSIIQGTISGDYVNQGATTIKNNAFQGNTTLTSVTFMSSTSTGYEGFRNCTGLVSASFPVANSIGGYSFRGCSRLANISFPSAQSVSTSGLQDCTSLAVVDFPSVTNINNYAFQGCTALKTIILRSKWMCQLVTSALTNTPFASGGTGGTLYVPRDLKATYQANNNWNSILTGNPNNQILAIEDMV